MEGIAPPLKCLLAIQLDLKNGKSLKESLTQYIQANEDSFSKLISEWLVAHYQGQDTKNLLEKVSSPYRKSLIMVFEMGFKGVPIYDSLKELEVEIRFAAEQEIELFCKKLPIFSLIPILFFQFPAFLILIIAPILNAIFKGFKI